MEKRSLTIAGHRTSVALEPEFWLGLEEVARELGTTLPKLIADIDRKRDGRNLASAIRLLVLGHYRGREAVVPGQDGAAGSPGISI